MAQATGINGLCLVFVTVRQPSYRTQIPESVTTVKDNAGEDVAVSEELKTRSSFTWDKHPIFSSLRKNQSEISALLNRSSINRFMSDEGEVQRAASGVRLMPVTRYPQFLLELTEFIERRDGLLDELERLWDLEVRPGIREAFGELYEYVEPAMPTVDEIRSKYRVDHPTPIPLSSLEVDGLDLTELNESQRDLFVQLHGDSVRESMERQFQGVFDVIVEELMGVCGVLVDGEADKETGEVKAVAIPTGLKYRTKLDEILSVLERAMNFKSVLGFDDQLMGYLTAAKERLATVDPRDMRQKDADSSVSDVIRNEMSQLRDGLRDRGGAAYRRDAAGVIG
jgi:hypothetical protein